MKKLVWQLPAVITGTAVLTFCGVSSLQAAMNGPLQERGAVIRAAQALPSQPAADAAPVTAADASPAVATPPGAERSVPAAPPVGAVPAQASGSPSCDDGASCRAPLATPLPAAEAADDAVAPTAEDVAGPVVPGPGKGAGSGLAAAPGQNWAADGAPAAANRADASAGNPAGKGNQGALNSAMNATRQLARQFDQLLGLREPPGLSGSQGNGPQSGASQGNGQGNGGSQKGGNQGNGRGNSR